MSRTCLAALALPLLLAAALTGCTDATSSATPPTTAATSDPAVASPSGSGEGGAEATISAQATAPSSEAPMAWPAELYETGGTTYADYLKAEAEAHGYEDDGSDIVGEAQGEGRAEVTVQTRTGYTYYTESLCAPDTPMTLEDSADTRLDADSCGTGVAGSGDGSKVTYTATTPDKKPIRLVIREMQDEATPDS